MPMQVILQDNIENLGKVGDIVKVKPGYARNFLIPRGLAAEASTRNVSQLAHQKRAADAKKGTSATRSPRSTSTTRPRRSATRPASATATSSTSKRACG